MVALKMGLIYLLKARTLCNILLAGYLQIVKFRNSSDLISLSLDNKD